MTAAAHWSSTLTVDALLVRFGVVRAPGVTPKRDRYYVGCGYLRLMMDEPLTPAGGVEVMCGVIRAHDGAYRTKIGRPNRPKADARAYAQHVLEVAHKAYVSRDEFERWEREARAELEQHIPLILVDRMLRDAHASDMPTVERLVLRTLSGYAPKPNPLEPGDDPYPAREKLANECGISLATLDRAIDGLVEHQWISKIGVVQQKPDGRRIYVRVNKDKLRDAPPGTERTSNSYALDPLRGTWWPADSRAALARKAPPPPPKKAATATKRPPLRRVA